MLLTDFGNVIAGRMRSEHRELARRWFDRLIELLPVEARDVFPTDQLLDHIPALIVEISEYLHGPEEAAIVANTAITSKARELGELRCAQQASLHQVLREYQILSGVLVAFVLEELQRLAIDAAPSEAVRLANRLHQAVDVLSQSTVESFVTTYTQTIADQRERLEEFTRLAAHEWRQPLTAVRFAVSVLGGGNADADQTSRAIHVLERNVEQLVSLTRKLESVARIHQTDDNPVVQEVSAGTIAHETARQLRDMAEAEGVEIRVSQDLPTLVVDVGRLELILVNLISNGIKYADAGKAERYVQIDGRRNEAGGAELTVADNGIGIPKDALGRIFQRFSRAHAERRELSHVSGMGLGLSIVDDCVHSLGGTIRLESEEGVGTRFVVSLPSKG
jgi:signal transduction histidine kinase